MAPSAIKALYERWANVMRRRPTLGRASGHARVRMGEGYACQVEWSESSLRADQAPGEGGDGAGPHPEQLMRASLGASLAMGYRTWGARLETAIEAVEVEVTCDYDVRGQLGVDAGVAIGWQRVLFAVHINSSADAAAVRRVVELADRLSPLLANLSPAIERIHTLTVRRVGSGPADGNR